MSEILDERFASRRCSLVSVLTLVVLGAAGIFILPWFVPFSQAINSLSYTYGFNNSAAWMAVAALLAIACILRAPKQDADGITLERLLSGIAENGGKTHPRLFAAFIGVAVTGAALQILCYTLLPSNDFGEVGQHTARLDLMLLGQRPHAGFHYIFGPGMLYVPYSLFRLGGGAVSIDIAYCAALVADWVIGTFLLYYVVKHLGGRFRRTAVFLCISLLFLSPTMMAYQYTPVRYFLPLASLVVVHRAVSRGSFRTVVAASVVSPLAALSFSPDAGIVTTAALLVYFIALVRTPVRKYSIGALVCGLTAAIGLTAFGSAYLDSIRSYSSSASAFPIFPTLTVLAFLAAVFVIVPAFVSLGLRRTPAGSLALGMAIALGLEIPPALGRCDLMHIAWNGAGTLLIALAALTSVKARRTSYRAALCGYLILFPLSSLTAMTWHSYGEAVLRFLHGSVAHADHGAAPAPSAENAAQADSALAFEIRSHSPYTKPKHFSPDLQALLRYKKIGLPFGAPEEIRRFLKLTGRFVPEFWPETFSYLANETAIARKLRDLEAMDVILVPREIHVADNFITVPVSADLRVPAGVDPALHRATAAHVLTTLTLFPVWLPKARNAPLLPELRIMTEIAKRYSARGTFREFMIAVKREPR